MPRRIEQPTLFELTACDEFKRPLGLTLAPVSPTATPNPKSDPSIPEGNVSSGEAGVFKAVSPLAKMPLHEVCAVCGREINGSGFVILDYEELGAFCDQDCRDRHFRHYLYEAPDEGNGV